MSINNLEMGHTQMFKHIQRASISVKMFFNYLTARLKPHRKKTLDHKKI
jgi:hypothetical protein